MVLELTDGTYTEVVESADKPIFIDFYSPMCGPCQAVLPLLDHLDGYFKDEAIIAKVDVRKIQDSLKNTRSPLCLFA